EELTAKDGEYKFTIEADTIIKVTYEDIDYTLTVEDPENGVTNLTPAKENNKYNEGTEISFTIKVAGKKAKVEKIVGGKSTTLTKGEDGKYSFKMTSDTTIEVTYEDVEQYTLRKDDLENGIKNLTIEDAEGNKYNAGSKISFTVEDKPGKVANVRTVIGNLLDSAGEQKGIKATVIKKGPDGKYSFNIATDTTIRVSYKLVSARANKYDKVFVNTYEVNPERVMNIYKNTRQPNQPNATLGAYNYSFDGDNFVFMINREIEDKRITAMRGTGLADGLVGIFTSNLAGKAPQKFLKKVTLVEKNTGEKVELNESDLKSFSDKWFGFNTMMKKGFPGMNVQSKLSDLAGKKFDVTYEYQEGNTVYKKARTLEFNYDYK
ncbi:hypothetical protein, partial [Peptoniphilus sp. HMSC075B08]|uniref:hypothetical protein n=1 Tax=Peptoniphilus sp. HMSC075B08 TaxID=1739525 RepID=UPI00143BB94B